jgi:hypothetical protein
VADGWTDKMGLSAGACVMDGCDDAYDDAGVRSWYGDGVQRVGSGGVCCCSS